MRRIRIYNHRFAAVELLERRYCLDFSWAFASSVLTLTGTTGNDRIDSIYIKEWCDDPEMQLFSVWYRDDVGDKCTNVNSPNTGTPQNPATLQITIYGLAGNDTVDLWASAVVPQRNLGGFDPQSVKGITFWGAAGQDTFNPPMSPIDTGLWPRGAVVIPAYGYNVNFEGGDDNDTFYNRDDPEYFHGGNGADTATIPAGGSGYGDDYLDGGIGTGSATLSGGKDNDIIIGQNAPDTLDGGDGDDSITGNGGGDTINGGQGNDVIYAGAGSDQVLGDSGDDTLFGDEDGDVILGGAGNDVIMTGDSGASTVASYGHVFQGPAAFEYAYGEDGDDTINANDADGNVYVSAGLGNDYVDGSEFGDRIEAGADNDWVFGWGGNDIINTGTSGAVGTLAPPFTDPEYFEVVYGDGGLDTITATSASGKVFVDGGGGNDIIDGSEFDDALGGGDDNDTIHGWGGADGIDGGYGNDLLYGDDGQDYVAGNYGADEIYGGANYDHLSGFLGVEGSDGDMDIMFGGTTTQDEQVDAAWGNEGEGDWFDWVTGVDYWNGYLM